MFRYIRQTCLAEFGLDGQNRLKEASVAVVGAGGIGCPVLQYLAAAGLGTIGIIDGDTVEESNLQRQVLFGTSTLGENKAAAAAAYINNLNPHVNAEVYSYQLTSENASSIISRYDFVIDCTDNFYTRYLIDECCEALKKAWIYGAIHRYEAQVAIFNCHGSQTYLQLFPKQSIERIPDCADSGVLGVLPGLTGMLQATECIKLITGIGEPLVGQLLVFNVLTMQFVTFPFAVKKPKIAAKGECPVHPLSAKEYRDNAERYLLVDVREPNEVPVFPMAKRIPLSELPLRIDELITDKEIAFVCRAGNRSRQAAVLLAKTNRFNRLYAIYEALY
jgi:molybdopterin/thiamine biosynthesis adenylyltransferase/rhodanese-related sulfurtransferase